MANSRKVSKKKVGGFLETFEIDALKELATANNTDFTGLLRIIAAGKPYNVVSHNKDEEKNHA